MFSIVGQHADWQKICNKFSGLTNHGRKLYKTPWAIYLLPLGKKPRGALLDRRDLQRSEVSVLWEYVEG
jgi:hypothetical protein